MKSSWKFLKEAKAAELLASAVLAVEALYFIIATVVVTGFGIVYAQGSADAHGLLGMASLPLVAIGAFAVWSLALLHVLPPERAVAGTSACGSSAHRVSMAGYYLVVGAHLIYAFILVSESRLLLAGAIVLLAGLLLVCSVTQVHLPNRRRRAAVLNQTPA